MTAQFGMRTNNTKYAMHPAAAESELIQRLADGPKPASELPASVRARTVASQHIAKLSVGQGGRLPPTLYYLHGDERRAAREFIRRHPEFVEGETGRGGKLAARLSRKMYRLIVQEQQIAECSGDN